MYRIIGGDQKEYGPVTGDELRHWIAEGRLSGQSLARAEVTTEWKPLANFPEFADALRAIAGQAAPAAGPVPPLNAEAWSAEILARQPEVQVGRCLALSWSLLKGNLGLFFGATFFAWIIGLVCQFIPLIGEFVYWAVNGILYGGLCLVFLKRIRGQPATMADVFEGFKREPVQLLLAGLLTSLLARLGLVCCLVLPGLYLLIAWTFSLPLVADKRLEFWSAMELSRKVVTRVWFQLFGLVMLAFLPVILADIVTQVKISLAFLPIVQDVIASGQPDFGKIMEKSMQLAGMSVVLTLLLKFVLLLNLPFAVGALMHAYEDLFGPRTTPTA